MTTGSIGMATVCCAFALIVLISTLFEYILTIRAKVTTKQDDQYDHLLGGYQPPPRQPHTTAVRSLLCFSLVSNYKSFVDIGSNGKKGHFPALDGIRTISNCWVIMGHSLLFMMSLGLDNEAYLLQSIRTFFSFQSLTAAEFAVDTFFLLSGFLVTHSLLSSMDRLQSSKGSSLAFAVKYIVHRIARLSPLYIFVLFFFWKLSPMLGTGPFWYLYDQLTLTCDRYWWTNILYINNLYPTTMNNECMNWSWFLANDMQMYLLAPIIVITFRFKKQAGYALVALLVALTFTTNIWLSLKFNIGTFFDINMETTTFASDIYQKTYTRIGPYVVGSALAFAYTHDIVRRWYSSSLVRVPVYIVAFSITFILTYIPYTNFHISQWTTTQNALYNGLAHTMFAVGVALFLLATFYGHGGMLLWLLERSFWRYTSKLTYSTYLMHPIILYTRIFSNTRLFHYSPVEFAYFYIEAIHLPGTYNIPINLNINIIIIIYFYISNGITEKINTTV
eukprot:gene7907-9283_t